MEYTKHLSQRTAIATSVIIMITAILVIGAWLLSEELFANDQILQIAIWGGATIVICLISTSILTKLFTKPIKTLADVIVFAGHSNRGGTAPTTEKLVIGRELVSALAMQVYDLASMSSASGEINDPNTANEPQSSPINLIDLPILGINDQQEITILNHSAEVYFEINQTVLGQKLYDVLKIHFMDENTFEAWLQTNQKSVLTASKTWERVRTVDQNGEAIKQFDLVASFSKGNSSGTETMLCVFDQSHQYAKDDQDISLVAMAVHELRTPLTIMRGYIEVFQDEIGPDLNEELRGFMHKMQASAEQLTAFVGNILNVARIEDNQLMLTLKEDSWHDIVKAATDDLALRAGVHGKHIELKIANDLPAVAVDRISVFEVLNNLVDNAIKYSGKSEKIIISSTLNQEGMIETSVQDFGIGIPAAVMPDLFSKFYRSHKSSVKITGTGLGLYLCKAIVSAHGGNVWVRSKENEGSVFTFTLQPYDTLKHEQKDGENGIMRGAHGWIKNHSMNRQ